MYLANITHKDLNKTCWVKPDYINKKRKWFLIDAQGLTLGRLAVDIAKILLGKNNPYYCDFWDTGDFVVVTNTQGIKVTGNKSLDKIYYRYSGHKGNLREKNFISMMAKDSTKVLWLAVKGMLPNNSFRKSRLKRIKLFKDSNHIYKNLKLQTI